MHTIFLNGGDYAAPRELHEALKRLLDLPDYYGHNADALHDCLAERREVVNLSVLSPGNGEVNAALRKCAAVITDMGGRVTGL